MKGSGLLRFTITMTPVPKGRPRLAPNGVVFTPAKTKKAERFIREVVRANYSGAALDGALSVTIQFWLPRLKTKVRELPTGKPDLDNLAKTVLDAGNGLLWADDSQICHFELSKHYCSRDGNPGIVIEVDSL